MYTKKWFLDLIKKMMSMIVLISQMLKIDNLKNFFLELLIHIYYLE